MIVRFRIESVADADMAANIMANIFSGKHPVSITAKWELKRGLDWSILLEALSAKDEIPRDYIDRTGMQILDEIKLEF